MKIIVNNNKCRILGESSIIHKLREKTKIKNPGAYWTRVNGGGHGWDGYNRFITETTNMFSTGLLPQMLGVLKDLKQKVKIIDQREHIKEAKRITKLGPLTLRDYQGDSYNGFIDNEIYGLKFQRGILYEATNSGKNLISAAIFKSYPTEQGIFLINNTVIFTQALRELNELLPGKIGEISSKKTEIKQYTVCMVQTLKNRMKKIPTIKKWLLSIGVVIVDEADEVINRKDTRDIFGSLYNAPIRAAMTGTALMNKNPLKNQFLISFFGPIIHKTTNKELVDKGHSAKPKIKFIFGEQTEKYKDYTKEYLKNIVKHKGRNSKIWRISKKQIKRGKGPVVILVKLRAHYKYLMKYLPESMEKLSIKYMDGTTKGFIREKILEDFKAGKVKILIASLIIKRGLNIKGLNTLINAAGGDSQAAVTQIFGRALRKNEEHKYVWVYEFMDYGRHIMKHSKHRIKYYKAQDFEVKELYKTKLKNVIKLNTI